MARGLDLYIRTHYTLIWDPSKSEWLKRERGVSFEELIQGRIVAIKEHPNRGHQDVLLFEYRAYIWVAPCVARGSELFLKTLYPSRKHTKAWRKGGFD